MPFRNGIDQPLITAVLLQTLLDFDVRRSSALEIAFVHHDDVREIEHHDFLQLQPAAVIRIHHQHREIDNSIFLKRHRLLASADGLDNDVIEIGAREQREAIVCCGRKAAGLSARSHAAHEYAIVLRVDHGGPITEQGSLAYYAWIMRQDRDPAFRISVQETEHQLVNQCRLSGATRTSETDDARCAQISNFEFRISNLPLGR